MNKIVRLKNLSKNLHKTTSHHHQYHHQQNHIKSLYTLPKTPSITPQHLHHSQGYNCHFPTNGFFSKFIFSKSFSNNNNINSQFNSFVGPRICLIRSHFHNINNNNNSSHKRNWSSWARGYSADNIVLGLIVANAAVFVLWRVFDRDFMLKNFTISVDNIKSGRIHTLITSAFSHIDMGHIASNMIGLYFFGSNIGRHFGPEYLLKLYFAGAVVGSIFYVVHHVFISKMFKQQGTFVRDSSKTPALGASGAVNAILLLDIFLFPKATLMFDFFIPVPAILLGIYLIGQDIVRILEGNQQISGSVHLGGAAVAAAAWLRLKKGRGFRF